MKISDLQPADSHTTPPSPERSDPSLIQTGGDLRQDLLSLIEKVLRGEELSRDDRSTIVAALGMAVIQA